MTTEFPILAEVMARGMFMCKYVVGDDPINEKLWERTSEVMREACRTESRAALAALVEACTIRTVEQLQALPGKSVVHSDGTWEVFRDAVDPHEDGEWWSNGNAWGTPELPALLVWHPDWAVS